MKMDCIFIGCASDNFFVKTQEERLDKKTCSQFKSSVTLIENKTFWLLVCPSFLMKQL